MWKMLKYYLFPPKFDGDEEKTKAARLIYPILLLFFISPILYFLFSPVQISNASVRIFVIFLFALFSLINIFLVRKGYVQFASQLFLIGFGVISVGAIILTGGISGQSTNLVIVFVILAGFLRGKRAIFYWGLAGFLIILGIYLLEGFGLIPPSGMPIKNYLISFNSFLAAIALIFYFALGQIDTIFAKFQQELSEKEAAQAELAFSEKRFRNYLQLSPTPTLITNSQYATDYVNQQFTELLGYTTGDIPDFRTWAEKAYPDPDYRKIVEADWNTQYQKISENGGIITVEYDVVDKWGETHIIRFYVSFIDNKAILQLNDVTLNRKMEAEIKANEILYRSLFDNVQDGIFLMDQNRFIECNQKVLELFDCKKEQIIGKAPHQFSPKFQPNGFKSADAAQTYIQAAMRGKSQTFEWTHIRFDGTPFQALITLTKTTLPNGDFILAQVRDITQQKQDQATIVRSTRRMDTLFNLDLATTTSFDLQTILTVFLDLIINQVEADAVSFLLYDPHLQLLIYESGLGFHTNTIQTTARLPLGYSMAGQAALTRKTVYYSSLDDVEINPELKQLIDSEDFTAYFGVPMIVKGELKGVMEIFQRGALDKGEDWFAFIEALANRAAIAIDNAHLFSDLQRANMEMIATYDTTLEGWAYLLNQRDYETEEHTRRVVDMTEKLARKLGIPDRELIHILRGALLHDIGKIVVPDKILYKPGPLDEEEWAVMKKHPVAAYTALSRIDYLKRAAEIPYCHHEHYDGSGYPRGLKGDRIPKSARIFSIIDVWDALSNDRPYRKAWDFERIKTHIKVEAGKQFDPEIVDAFFALMEENPFLFDR